MDQRLFELAAKATSLNRILSGQVPIRADLEPRLSIRAVFTFSPVAFATCNDAKTGKKVFHRAGWTVVPAAVVEAVADLVEAAEEAIIPHQSSLTEKSTTFRVLVVASC